MQQTKTAICTYKNGALSSGVDVLTEAAFETANVGAHCDLLVRADQSKNSYVYEPTIVVGTYRVEEYQTLRLAVAGYVLEHLQRTSVAAGYAVTFDGECHRINLRPLFKTVASILQHIKEWSAEQSAQPPPVILNKHCPHCPFESVCRQEAEATDDLSLLDRMTPKAIRRYHDKGIFTVKQLSFVFKPRRRRRRARIHPPHFNVEIQALAIRTGKIYVQTAPEIQRCDTELFLDIEGVPDQQFSYLIGLLIRDRQTVTHHTFWADNMEDEESIWAVFIYRSSIRLDGAGRAGVWKNGATCA
jgi:predicted RecB family nuclease